MTTVAGLAWCPCPDMGSARQLAHSLLDEGLIVCANVIPAVHSIFKWDAKREESAEVGLLMKTEAKTLERLRARLEALHPYDTPVVIGWRADSASSAALDWIGAMGRPSADG